MRITTVYDIPQGFTRERALTVACPKCGAGPSDPCTGRRQPTNIRTSPHIQRYDALAQHISGDRT